MSNSKLVDYTYILDKSKCPAPYNYNHWSSRGGKKIDAIVIHHCAGVMSVEQIGRTMARKEASSTYGIGSDARVGQYVDEAYRPWTSSSYVIDSHAVTIETSNSANGGNWPVSDKVLAKLIDLVTDICQRNGIKKCTYTGGKDGVLQMHCWYHATACPGPYLKSKFAYIANEVNKRLTGETKPSASTSTTTTKPSTTTKTTKPITEAVVNAVIRGRYGNEPARSKRLAEAGYDPKAIQAAVDKKLGKTGSKYKPVTAAVVNAVIRGKYGTGYTRKINLKNAGYNPDAVQAAVNAKLRGK